MTRIQGRDGTFQHVPPKERFWTNVDKSGGEDACWLWTGLMHVNGYGYITDYWTKILAHRFSYAEVIGPIPEGKKVCHHCDVRNCVNPQHLYVGTTTDNNRDTVRRGRNNPPRGERHPGSKLTDDKVREIRTLYAAGNLSYAAIGRLYGLKSASIGEAVRRETWKHIE